MTIHHVFANKANIGDWLSALGIQRALGSQLAVTEHFCDEGSVAVTLAQLSKLGSDDFIIIGGGGLFMDYFEPFWHGFLALLNRPRYVIWGVGVCDHKARKSCTDVRLFQNAVHQAAAVAVRDSCTQGWLGWALNLRLAPCPSVLTVPPAAMGTGVLVVEHPGLLDGVVREQVRQATRPRAVTDNIVSWGDKEALWRVVGQYEKAVVVVSSRLHGCVLGLAMGKKVLAVSQDHKIESFMTAAGLSEWVCEPEKVSEALGRLDQQPDVSSFIKKARNANLEFARIIQKAYL